MSANLNRFQTTLNNGPILNYIIFQFSAISVIVKNIHFNLTSKYYDCILFIFRIMNFQSC